MCALKGMLSQNRQIQSVWYGLHMCETRIFVVHSKFQGGGLDSKPKSCLLILIIS